MINRISNLNKKYIPNQLIKEKRIYVQFSIVFSFIYIPKLKIFSFFQ